VRRAVVLVLSVVAAAFACRAPAPPEPSVLFVCEHGTAKSVAAAAIFNDVARRRGLRARAESRATDPGDNIPAPVRDGLAADGLTPDPAPARKVSPADLERATRVVAFGCDPTSVAPAKVSVERWDDVPPITQDYARSRDAMRAHIERLVDELAATQR
jgi:arsenate reductase (thioredoxin)